MNALPPRIPRKAKRETRWRSQAHLSFVRSHHCSVHDCAGMPIEAAHIRNGSGAGVGQKPDDWRAVSLCRDHHDQQHRLGEQTFWTGVAKCDPEALVAAFVQASPKRRDIEQAMKERAGAA